MAFAFSFFLGTVALLLAPALPPLWAVAAVGLVGLATLVFSRQRRSALALCGACCGLVLTSLHAAHYLDHRWPSRLDDERVIATVVVDSIPVERDSGWSFDATASIQKPEKLAQTLRLRVTARDPSLRFRAGETWSLALSLRAPRGRANPGSQDFERQQFRDRVHAMGTVVSSRLNRRIDEGHRPLTALREEVSRRIEERVADRDASALISALAVGDTGRVSREQWRIFNATGTTHLVAISGLHVTLFAMVAFFVARKSWNAGVRFGSRREPFAALVGFTAAAGYAVLAGLSVPTQRTLIMLGAWLVARSMARVSRPFQPFAWALFVVLLVDPFAPLSAGFWLSFAAMAAIILVTTGHFMRRAVWREAVAVQVVVTVALIPASLALFGSVSLIGPLVNVLAIPAMSWLLVPIVLLSVVLMPISTYAADAMLSLAAWLHDVGWPTLAAAGDLPWALAHASPPLWWYVLAIAALAMMFLPWPLTMRLAALVCVAPLTWVTDKPLDPGIAEITFLDVGEGTSVVVRTSRHVLVVGTGDSFGTGGRIAENVVAPFVRSLGARSVDRFFRVDAKADSSAGATALLAELPITSTWVANANTAGEPRFDCESAPSAWEWDGVDFTLLLVAAGSAGADSADACLLRVSAGGHRALIPIGLDAAGEAALQSGDLRSDIALVARNGSDSASTPLFIGEVKARWAVVSGRRGEPGRLRRALQRWEQGGSKVLATADQGAIGFRLGDPHGIDGPKARRVDHCSLWAQCERARLEP